MTYLRQVVGIGLCLAAGYFLADIFLIQVRTRTWLKLWLGIGLGLGLSSLSYFTWRLASIDGEIFLFLGELILAAGLGLVWLLLKRRKRDIEVLAGPPTQARLPSGWSLFLYLSLALAILSAVLNYLFGTLINPHGGWDAWAIWNLAARFLFSGDHWRNLFDPVLFHPDYPLLLGSSVARLWTYRSVQDLFSPALIGFLFFLGTLGLLMTLAKLTRSSVAATLAGLAFLGSSAILRIAPTQSADIPLGYYLLGSLGCLSLYQKYPKSGFLILSGVLLGLGAWTKNEGWMLAIAVLLGWVITTYLFQRRSFWTSGFLIETGWLMIGLISIIILPLIQKWFLAPATDIFALQNGSTLARLGDPARWIEVAHRFADMLFSLSSTVPFILLILLAVIFGAREKAFSRPDVCTNLITILIALLGYFLVYVVTPLDLTEHMRTSLDRVFAQLWPVAVFTMILLIRLPGDGSDQADQPGAGLVRGDGFPI